MGAVNCASWDVSLCFDTQRCQFKALDEQINIPYSFIYLFISYSELFLFTHCRYVAIVAPYYAQ